MNVFKFTFFMFLFCMSSLPSFGNDIRTLSLPAKDIIYDPVSQKIYASLPSSVRPDGNSVARIDPHTGRIEATLYVGSEPSRLAVSDNGQYLYVGLDSAAAVRRIELKTFTTGLQFSLGRSVQEGYYFAEDMEVLPGSPESVAVSRYRKGLSPRHAGVAIYDNGIPRAQASQGHTGSNAIEFSDSASRLYGLSLESGEGVRRLAVDASGVQQIDVIPNNIDEKIFFGWLSDLKYDTSLLYSPSGYTLDPEKKKGGPFYNADNEHFVNFVPPLEFQMVEPDSKTDRVYFLYKYGGMTAKVPIFKMGTARRMHTLLVPGVTGTAIRFIRWGADGLAFLTDSGQLFLLRSPLISSSETGVNLNVEQTAHPETVTRGETQTFTITVKNQGTETAADVLLLNTLSPGAAFVTATASQGSCSVLEGRMHCTLGNLAKDAIAIVNVAVKSLDTWTVQNTAYVSSRSVETNWMDNQSTLSTAVKHRLMSEDQGQINLKTNDLIYDPVRGKIYASVPVLTGARVGSIAVIEPESGIIEQSIPVGREPNKLALSDNGEFLYVGLDGEAAVLRLSLSDTKITKRYSLYPSDAGGVAPYALDIEVLPGTPTSIAVSRAHHDFSGVYLAIIDEGGMRRPLHDSHIRHSAYGIEFAETASILFGKGGSSADELIRYSLDSSGIVKEETYNKVIPALDDVEYDTGLLFTSSGRIVDPEMPARVGQFYGVPPRARVAPDAHTGRVFFLAGEGSTRQILSYDRRTFALARSLPISGVSGQAGSFIRWGADGLAFRTDSGQLVLIRTSLVPDQRRTSRLSVTQTATPDPVGLDELLTYRITVVNAGPDAAGVVNLYDILPDSAKIVSASSDRGGCADLLGKVKCELGGVAAGDSVEATIVIRTQVAAPLLNRVRVTSDTFDPNGADNVHQLETQTHFALGINRWGQLLLRTQDLVYDSSRRKIYASVPDGVKERGNTIAVIDPFAGTLGPFFPIGKDPGKLAISDDHRFLYVGLRGAGTVRRVVLSTMESDLEFSLGSTSNQGAYIPIDIKVLPGQPETVLVLKRPMNSPFNFGAVTVYDRGVPRPKGLAEGYDINWIGVAATSQGIYASGYKHLAGEGFLQLSLDTSGLKEQDFTYGMSGGGEIERGKLYNPGGAVYDLESRTLLGSYALVAGEPNRLNGPVEPDPDSGRTFFLTGYENDSHTLRVFDQDTFMLLNSIPFPGPAGYPNHLIRWGPDGLAYRTDRDQVILLRTLWRLPRTAGDVNQDGQVDVSDAVLVLSTIVGSTQLNEEQTIHADVSGDERLDVEDVIMILRIAIGLT